MTAAPSPHSRARARKRWTTGDSAVVRSASKDTGPTRVSTVPHSAARGWTAARAARIR